MAHLAAYQPRAAEHSVLYRVIDEHLETFLDAAAQHADGHQSSAGLFGDPTGIAVTASGTVYVVDPNAPNPSGGLYGAIFRVDPATGAQTLVSAAGNLVTPQGIAIAANGDLLVADSGPNGGTGKIIRVNPVTGAQTVVSTGGLLVDPVRLAITLGGDIFVSDSNAVGSACGGFGCGAVIKVNPVTGAQTVVSSGGNFFDPIGIVIGAGGDLFVADANAFGPGCSAPGCGGVIRVNPTTGGQTVVSAVGAFFDPHGIAVGASGNLLVADANCCGGPGGVISVNPTTGAQTILSSGGDFVQPLDLVVVSAVPAPAALGLLAIGLLAVALRGRRPRW